MRASAKFNRTSEIRRIRGELERDGFPRVQMFLLVALTGGAGFLASFMMLHAGVVEMWLRYLLAFGAAYIVFLLLLWLWLRTSADQYCDPGLADVGWPGGDAAVTGYRGMGGTFDGGGASGSFETASGTLQAACNESGIADTALGSIAEAEEFAIPLAVILLLAAIAFSSLFVVYSAPVLFAELVIDGVLAATLFRRLRGLETRHWLETALRHTALPFALTAAVVCASGWAMARYTPGAQSIGDFISQVR